MGKQKHRVRSLLIQQSTITGLLSSEIGDEIIEMRPFLVWMRNGCKRGLHIRKVVMI